MSRNIFRLKSKWFVLASGGSAVFGLYHYLKPDEIECQVSINTYSHTSTKWDHNWDKRDVSSLIKPVKHENNPSDDKQFDEKKAKLTPVATRHIFLVRHGQYEDWKNDDKDRKLTPLGRQQAAILGQRLKSLNFTYTRLIRSTMTRAIETSNIICKYLPTVPVETSDLLREGNPIPSEPPIGTWREEYKYYEDGPRIEAAFRKYFHRAPASQKSDSYEIVVCHANVIRYFICRLLQVPPEAWLRFSLYHCSITWVAIAPDGNVCVFSVGDSGFMPHDKLTKA
ncbi:serine/threonine-protein phosphatase PGAM5, mitochondrial-like [Argiope bruennichi]|uniref:Serine/threonine-protein phosphatase PGAM5, mitochondrial n=1 Tax=Argiope bruennichi TaxID=94029 RepID=A0A8T0E214_ARGBR|nr:serine/threonine-protein phosphatase PGAM5, mitochondrial-like [Argiope bruennichi]KAF8763941.1 Serine/threonine-protein phosphatase PGAM5 like protein [Argiope bruennichi]